MATPNRIMTALIAVITLIAAVGLVVWWLNDEPTAEERAQRGVEAINEAADKEDLAECGIDLEVAPKKTIWRGVSANATVAPDDEEAIRKAAEFLVSQYSDDPVDPDFVTGRIITENPPTSYKIDPRLNPDWLVGLFAEPIEAVSDVAAVQHNGGPGEGPRSDRIDVTIESDWQALVDSSDRLAEVVETYVPSFGAAPIMNLRAADDEGEGVGPKLNLQQVEADSVPSALEMMAELMRHEGSGDVAIVSYIEGAGDAPAQVSVKNHAKTAGIPEDRVKEIVAAHFPDAEVI
ncbi:hypothetical protein QP027_01490 [Corynebacterium breve]|uniref:Uncharacterized protein n=1 Tax=Corynebacterium breve TaxID=3049799 RepID=A0ABY8VF18_9CORY|nr:hypothetical protein [Corynebacterium breve]WIM68098.1 hypothetical protein QP027_01490 [Corynebacterium breve]